MMTEAFGGASGGACFAAVTPAYGIDNTMSGKQIIKGTMRSWPRRPRPQMQLRRRAGWTARFDTQARRGPWTSCESSSPPGRRMRARCASNVCSQEDPTLHFYGSQLGKSQGTHPRGRTRTAQQEKGGKQGRSERDNLGSPAPGAFRGIPCTWLPRIGCLRFSGSSATALSLPGAQVSCIEPAQRRRFPLPLPLT